MQAPMIYEHTDIPAGMTCMDYHRARHPARHRRLRIRLWWRL